MMEKVNFAEGVPMPGMVCGNLKGANFVPVLRGSDWLIAYSAQGLMFELDLNEAWAGARAVWMNPRNGELSGEFVVSKSGITAFKPLGSGRNSDWVLLIEKK